MSWERVMSAQLLGHRSGRPVQEVGAAPAGRPVDVVEPDHVPPPVGARLKHDAEPQLMSVVSRQSALLLAGDEVPCTSSACRANASAARPAMTGPTSAGICSIAARTTSGSPS
jgi:hypothetical protein